MVCINITAYFERRYCYYIFFRKKYDSLYEVDERRKHVLETDYCMCYYWYCNSEYSWRDSGYG